MSGSSCQCKAFEIKNMFGTTSIYIESERILLTNPIESSPSNSGYISLLLSRLTKLLSQCYSNEKGCFDSQCYSSQTDTSCWLPLARTPPPTTRQIQKLTMGAILFLTGIFLKIESNLETCTGYIYLHFKFHEKPPRSFLRYDCHNKILIFFPRWTNWSGTKVTNFQEYTSCGSNMFLISKA